jgi:hypothetical protein
MVVFAAFFTNGRGLLVQINHISKRLIHFFGRLNIGMFLPHTSHPLLRKEERGTALTRVREIITLVSLTVVKESFNVP